MKRQFSDCESEALNHGLRSGDVLKDLRMTNGFVNQSGEWCVRYKDYEIIEKLNLSFEYEATTGEQIFLGTALWNNKLDDVELGLQSIENSKLETNLSGKSESRHTKLRKFIGIATSQSKLLTLMKDIEKKRSRRSSESTSIHESEEMPLKIAEISQRIKEIEAQKGDIGNKNRIRRRI